MNNKKIKYNLLPKESFIEDENKKLKNNELLKIENLVVNFKTKVGLLKAVRGVDLLVKRSEIVGLVGESGSGKSVLVKSIIGFNDNAILKADNMNLSNIALDTIKANKWIYIRGTKVAYIPQDPLMSLNPTKRISTQMFESIKMSEKRFYQWKCFEARLNGEEDKISQYKEEYKFNISKKEVYRKTIEILKFIGITDPEQKIKSYPHEFSGGMRQRIVIAMAVATKPDLIIADEPTTALDVTIQAKVLDLIKRIRDEMNLSIIFISHNISLVANFCDYIYVVYAGKIVEKGSTKDIFTNPCHPYTWALISSIPDANSQEKLTSISGTPPNMLSPPQGDAFAPRNKYALKIDFELQPPLFKVSDGHYAATWLLSPDAPKTEIPTDVLDKAAIALSSLNKKEDKNE